MPKRSCPFDWYSPQQLKNHVSIPHINREEHMQEVYAKTQEMLRVGAAKYQSSKETVTAQKLKDSFKCKICCRVQAKANVTTACSFCDKKICTQCVQQCLRCGEVFCSFCSTTNYDEPEERHFCLSCYQT